MVEMKYKYATAGIVFLVCFYVYLLTLAPTVWFIDSGELSAVASTLGIAHPTGYPLFILIGFIFTKLPISNSEVYNLNVMSAFFCSLGIFIFCYLIAYLLTKNEIKASDKPKKGSSKKETIKPDKTIPKNDFVTLFIIPASASLILAFSRTFWGAANSVEVYPIHVFFIILLSVIFLKAVFDTVPAQQNFPFIQQNKYYLLFALVLGLSFTNHLTTILLAPACL